MIVINTNHNITHTHIMSYQLQLMLVELKVVGVLTNLVLIITSDDVCKEVEPEININVSIKSVVLAIIMSS